MIKQKNIFDHLTNISFQKDKEYYKNLSEPERKDFNVFMLQRYISMERKYTNIISYIDKYAFNQVLVFNTQEFKNNEKLFLGGGSNVLFIKDFPGVVVLNKLKGIEIINEDNQNVWLKAMGGEWWNDLVNFIVENARNGKILKHIIVIIVIIVLQIFIDVLLII